jgi:preprotein translocase subunit SecG
MLYYLLVAVYVIVCLLLILVVLLQQGRGGDLASAFGGGGSSQTAFGARQGATVLTRASTILGALFMLGALGLAIVGRSGPSSVVGGTAAPAPTPAQQSAPATPASPAPAAPAPAQTPAEQPKQ